MLAGLQYDSEGARASTDSVKILKNQNSKKS